MDKQPTHTDLSEHQVATEEARFARLRKIGLSVGNVALRTANEVAKHTPRRLAVLGGYALVGAVISARALGAATESVLTALAEPDKDEDKPENKNKGEIKNCALGEKPVEFIKGWLPEDSHDLIADLTTAKAGDLAKNIVLAMDGDPDGPQRVLLEKFIAGAEDDEIKAALKTYNISDIKTHLATIKDNLNSLNDTQRVNIINETLGKKLLEEPDKQVAEQTRPDELALAA